MKIGQKRVALFNQAKKKVDSIAKFAVATTVDANDACVIRFIKLTSLTRACMMVNVIICQRTTAYLFPALPMIIFFTAKIAYK